MIKRIHPCFFAGIIIAGSISFYLSLPDFLGSNTPLFLTIFLIASGGYVLAVLRLKWNQFSIASIFGFAILFRIILLFTSPSLSDDVYRYVWDGHLLNSGINPYAFPVNSALLDAYDIPLRALVNHNWMASPYLPISQLIFAIVEYLIPQSVLPFQVTAVLFDLLTGWLILDLLRMVGLPHRNVLIYLWNPLVILEFAHGAHIDAAMIFLMMLSVWFLVKESGQSKPSSLGSAITLAAATLTKFLPILLLPVFWWRWRWTQRFAFGLIILSAIGLFIPGAGLGIGHPSDGTGVFGALRIYLQQWNYNGGLYHWLEVWISGYPTPGAVPIEMVAPDRIFIAKAITTGLLGIAVLLAARLAWKITYTDQHNQNLGSLGIAVAVCTSGCVLHAEHAKHTRTFRRSRRFPKTQNLKLIWLILLPLGAYLLTTTTVHPWYVTIILPLLPFLFQEDERFPHVKSFMWPWMYFSIAVSLSYLTYLDPNNLRETTWVRLVEYMPLYTLLGYSIYHAMIERKKTKIVEI